MTFVVAVSAFGRELPDPKYLLGFVVLAVVFLIFNRNGGLGSGRKGNTVGEGMEYRCQRCGRQFQPQQKTLEDDGDVARSYNDRCPSCGWDIDWGKPDAFGKPSR